LAHQKDAPSWPGESVQCQCRIGRDQGDRPPLGLGRGPGSDETEVTREFAERDARLRPRLVIFGPERKGGSPISEDDVIRLSAND
jgi:hypothetical protein